MSLPLKAFQQLCYLFLFIYSAKSVPLVKDGFATGLIQAITADSTDNNVSAPILRLNGTTSGIPAVEANATTKYTIGKIMINTNMTQSTSNFDEHGNVLRDRIRLAYVLGMLGLCFIVVPCAIYVSCCRSRSGTNGRNLRANTWKNASMLYAEFPPLLPEDKSWLKRKNEPVKKLNDSDEDDVFVREQLDQMFERLGNQNIPNVY